MQTKRSKDWAQRRYYQGEEEKPARRRGLWPRGKRPKWRTQEYSFMLASLGLLLTQSRQSPKHNDPHGSPWDSERTYVKWHQVIWQHVPLRLSCVVHAKRYGVHLPDFWTLLAILFRCRQPRRKSWLNSEAKFFPQIYACNICRQQIGMLLMLLIWTDSLFASSRGGCLSILCACMCACLHACECVCGVQSVLTASFPKPKWDPKTPSSPLSMVIPQGGPNQAPLYK